MTEHPGTDQASQYLLSEVEEGWRVEVVAYLNNGRQAQRLAELGLTPGTPLRILRSSSSQPLLICVRGTHLAMDRNAAAGLSVRVLECRRRAGQGRMWMRRLRQRRGRNDSG